MAKIKAKINCDLDYTSFFTYNPKTGQLFLGSYAMTEAEIKSIQEEIKFLEKTRIWEVWQNTIKKQAIDTGMYNSTSFDDMRTAKAFLKVLAVLQDINTVIKSWKPKVVNTFIPNEPINV